MGDFSGVLATLAAGAIPTDDEWSSITDMLDAVTSAWIPYTPAWTGSVSNPAIVNGTIVGGYTRAGKLGMLKFTIVMGAGTTFGSGVYGFGLPSGWVSASTIAQQTNCGSALIRDNSGATHFAGSVLIPAGSSSMEIRVHGSNQIGPTSPMTFAVSDFIEALAIVELA